MERNPQDSSDSLPLILLSGDNARSALVLHHALVNHGLRVRFAPSYEEVEALLEHHPLSAAPPIVLLEISGAHAVEAAVHAALQLKRRDSNQFVGYLADPVLHTSGLAGDAIFPRGVEQLARALQRHFADD